MPGMIFPADVPFCSTRLVKSRLELSLASMMSLSQAVGCVVGILRPEDFAGSVSRLQCVT